MLVSLQKKLLHALPCNWGWICICSVWGKERSPDSKDAIDTVWMRSRRAKAMIGGDKTWVRHVGQEYIGGSGKRPDKRQRKVGIQFLDISRFRATSWNNKMYSRLASRRCSGWPVSCSSLICSNHPIRQSWQNVWPHSAMLTKRHWIKCR